VLILELFLLFLRSSYVLLNADAAHFRTLTLPTNVTLNKLYSCRKRSMIPFPLFNHLLGYLDTGIKINVFKGTSVTEHM